MLRCLTVSADCGIGQWMEGTPNSFEIVCNALVHGYEVKGSIEEPEG